MVSVLRIDGDNMRRWFFYGEKGSEKQIVAAEKPRCMRQRPPNADICAGMFRYLDNMDRAGEVLLNTQR